MKSGSELRLSEQSCAVDGRASTILSAPHRNFFGSAPSRRAWLKFLMNKVGFDTTDWVRVVMYERCFSFIRSLGPEQLDALEISAGPQWKRSFQFRSFAETQFPEFDICSQRLERQFDLVIADQVFEHLKWPYRAGRNVLAMLRPGGHFIVTVPFLVRIHKSPMDCSRWSEEGLRYFLQE